MLLIGGGNYPCDSFVAHKYEARICGFSRFGQKRAHRKEEPNQRMGFPCGSQYALMIGIEPRLNGDA